MANPAILLKLTGELLTVPADGKPPMTKLVPQIVDLAKHYTLGIVLGGGNFFRGDIQGKALGLSAATGHEVGMLATILNGRIVQEMLENAGIRTVLMSALTCRKVAKNICQQTIVEATREGKVMIFVGGTGNPFFTTDTNAVTRALQIGATEVWKATKVDGIYDKDPVAHSDATRYDSLTYDEAIAQKLGIMDLTAMALASEHNLKTYVFDIFADNALGKMQQDRSIATVVTT